MASRSFTFSHPDRFVVGTVGLPGKRTFFLQAVGDGSVVTVTLEKEQVEMLGERMNELLDMVRARGGAGRAVPAAADPELADNAGLEMPVDPEFRVGTMSLGWDTAEDHLLVECLELTAEDTEAGVTADPEDDAEDEKRAALRVILTGPAAREFARRADQVVSAGRADCPFCALPLDPEGHLCPRANGIPR
ncbi:DUF3090 domain-containing protein [Brevibacterium sp. BRM-1]|uniref:DUF3090 domain-containing protein n=1 Tax=Brevibacterium sp. BRM-1 TaxID=2999062 RepID=UPI00227DE009|nr:DUF3090 domain-containing protein [Brevibacterium sp. BRM-1]WAL40789.1 DUF3090 domain-containing protein [Brevibacterium sp. BRM-1]